MPQIPDLAPSDAAWTTMRGELAAARDQDRPPHFESHPPQHWVKVLDRLLDCGEIEIAAHAMPGFEAYATDLDWPRNMSALLAILPAAPTGVLPLVDRPHLDVLPVPVAGSDTVIFAFCGVRHRIGMPTTIFHRLVQQLGCSVVYLRDFRRAHYLKGVRGLGGDRAETIHALKTLTADLGARRVLCVGNSSGGYGALLYGLELEAEAVLNFSGPTNLDPEFNRYLNRGESALALSQELPNESLDMRARYLAAPKRPRAAMVFGEFAWDDRLHGEHMGGSPGVELISVSDYQGHSTISELLRRDQLSQLLEDLMNRLTPALDAPAPSP